MASSLVVLRTAVLFVVLMVLVTGLYVRHVTSITANAAAQSAASAAAQAAVSTGWPCGTTPPPESVTAATRAVVRQTGPVSVQPVAVDVYTEACNLLVAVTLSPLATRVSALSQTAVACRAAGGAVALGPISSC